MSIDVGNEVRQGTARSIDIRFRFVEWSHRLVINGLLQRTRGVMQIIAFADIASPVFYEASSSINRDRALKAANAVGQLDLRRVSYQSPLEIVVMVIVSTATTGTAFRLIHLGERVADLRDRWATSKSHVARSEMEAAYYKMLEEQIHGEGRDRSRYLKDIRPLTVEAARALLDVESIEEQPEPP